MPSSPRAAVAAAFLIHSTVSGTWAPRLPAIKESLGLSDGELGTALVGLASGFSGDSLGGSAGLIAMIESGLVVLTLAALILAG